MDKYHIIKKVGEGAHGTVFKARLVKNQQEVTSNNSNNNNKNKNNIQEFVALKKIPLRKLEDGLPINIVREVLAYSMIHHENVG